MSLPTAAAAGSQTSRTKARGIAYTPPGLADFVAGRMVEAFPGAVAGSDLRVLDPALGEGQLVLSLLARLVPHRPRSVTVHGYDTDSRALPVASRRIARRFPDADLTLRSDSFPERVLAARHRSSTPDLFGQGPRLPEYDFVIANPPYVRTQTLGGARSREIADDWRLSGRVDLYFAFVLAIAEVLAPGGTAGLIVSNRFMTTRAGASVREALAARFAIRQIWDLGDTKLFDAAVLPAVLILGAERRSSKPAAFSSIYETDEDHDAEAATPLAALQLSGVVRVGDGRRFRVRHGTLCASSSADDSWHVVTPSIRAWIRTVADHTWATFGSAGRVRVGVKTCADKVFVRDDWDALPASERPRLLRPLVTHRVAGPYRPQDQNSPTRILYPHHVVDGRRRAVDLADYPRDAAYLARHRALLERRRYLTDSGRKWYEIWVPQDPDAWSLRKVVFRDISAEPTFWLDAEGQVVNGDCYWWVPRAADDDLLWLALAVGNSSFIATFYDRRFNNRLYAGRRRFMAQYVSRFPLPDPRRSVSKAVISAAQSAYREQDPVRFRDARNEIDNLVARAFGVRD